MRESRLLPKRWAKIVLGLAFDVLLLPLTLPIVALVRVLRPTVVVRFRVLACQRIGTLALSTELYLCKRDIDNQKQKTIDIFFLQSPVSNHQLKRMWSRKIWVSPLGGPLDRLNRCLPGSEKHVVPWGPYANRDIHGLLERMPGHLAFTLKEEQLGAAMLTDLGITGGSPFVCIHSRDPAYLDYALPGSDWSYHNYRDSSIENFILAAEELARREYFVVRTGATVTAELKTANPMIIDYAVNGRSEFLDIFLGARCRFYLGDPSGFNAIPMIFRRPLVVVNTVPLEYASTWGSNYLLIPKKLWLRRESRFMTFREIVDSGVGRFQMSRQYERLGIEVVENKPEEITAVAVEMDERLNGTWVTTEEDEELQRRFWLLFKPSELHGTFLSRIGAEFLRQNRGLLE